MKNKWCVFSISIIMTLSVNSTIQAAVLRVPSQYATLKSAMNATADGDTILVADGTYKGPDNRGLLVQNLDLSIQSENGPEGCIIDCESKSNAFNFFKTFNVLLNLNGFTIRNGNDSFRGGGLYIEESNPKILNCFFQDCYAGENGGAIFEINATTSISHCKFIANSSGSQGGALAIDKSSGSVDHCLFDNNHSEQAGAIFITDDSRPQISTCTLWNNYANNSGGGAMIEDSSPMLFNCFVWNNLGRSGGGIYLFRSNPQLFSNWFQGNLAAETGGAIMNDHQSEPILMNNLINENIASQGGGIYVSFNTKLIASNLTCANNQAVTGGGIYAGSGNLTLENSIIWANSDDQIFIDTTSSNVKISYSDVQGGASGDGNFNADPLFVTGASHSYFLSQTSAGQSKTSPCVNRGNLPASEILVSSVDENIYLSDLSTRTDLMPDAAAADLGYHNATSTGSLKLTITMPDHHFSPGNDCNVLVTINNQFQPMLNQRLVVMLDIQNMYWFWDGWTADFDYIDLNVPLMEQTVFIIPTFTWPDTQDDSFNGITFWAALLSPDFTRIVGGDNGLDKWTFSFGPE